MYRRRLARSNCGCGLLMVKIVLASAVLKVRHAATQRQRRFSHSLVDIIASVILTLEIKPTITVVLLWQAPAQRPNLLTGSRSGDVVPMGYNVSIFSACGAPSALRAWACHIRELLVNRHLRYIRCIMPLVQLTPQLTQASVQFLLVGIIRSI
jgi:hypothetical protein